MRERLDQLLVQRGLADSREKAQRLIRAGQVSVDGQVASKPGHSYKDSVEVTIAEAQRFVGRGGDKLEAAFEAFPFQVDGEVCIDVGSSTGGFTDCMLQHGASRVYAVDVGKGQLDWKLRNDDRVLVMEEVNARYLEPTSFDPQPSRCTMDVSFISVTKVMPAIVKCLTEKAELVTLIKPQFEAGKEQVGKGGVVRDATVHDEVVERIKVFGTEELHLSWIDVIASPLLGPAGNKEFLAYWRKQEN